MALEIANAEKFVKEKLLSVTTTQMRKFLSAVSNLANRISVLPEGQLDKKQIDEVQMLRVRLAYQAGRESKLKPLYINLEKEIANIKKKEDWQVFANYMEAIIAYHKFNGGKDN